MVGFTLENNNIRQNIKTFFKVDVISILNLNVDALLLSGYNKNSFGNRGGQRGRGGANGGGRGRGGAQVPRENYY